VLIDLCLHLEQGDIELSDEGFARAARLILDQEPRILGFSSMCNSYPAALRIAQECKRLAPKSLVIFGGPQASVTSEATIKAFPFVDIVVRGEGEETLPALLTALKTGDPLEAINGITFRRGDEVVSTPSRPVIMDLDALPFPRFGLVPDLERYFAHQEVREAAIEAGRGCPYNCTFCSTSSFFARRYRMKSPSRLLAEMRWFADRLGITSFTLHHDNFCASVPKLLEFCRAMEEAGVPYTWRCSSRTDNISADCAERMARAGCRSIFFGIESGSPDMQRSIKKRLDVSTARDMVAACLQHGIRPTCSFILGFPEETESDLNQTLMLALECRLLGTASIQLHPLSPLPGTELTTQNRYPLRFRPEAVRVHDASPAGQVSAAELAMIQAYPEIFSSFYIIEPVHLPVDLVYLSAATLTELIRHVPLSLYWYTRAADAPLTEVARRLQAYLPGGTLSWPAADVLAGLGRLIDQLELPWLGELLSWETLCYRIRHAPPVEPPENPDHLPRGPLEWAPGAAMLTSRHRLDRVMAPPDLSHPQPLPQPDAEPTAYLVVRDGMRVRTLRLAPDLARVLASDLASASPRPSPDLLPVLRAGILRPVASAANG